MLRLIKPTSGCYPRRLALSIQRRSLSESTSVPPPTRIISRRAWQQHLQKHSPPKSSGNASSKAKEEKPWPKSLQIAGYTMATIFIPYSVAWFLASNGSARALLHSDVVDNVLRHHFGQEEFGALSYYDVVGQGQEPHYQLDGEPSYAQRTQEAFIESLKNAQVRIRLRVDDNEIIETVVPGATLAKSANVLREIGREGGSDVVAVDFGNVVQDDGDAMDGKEELTDDVVVSLESDKKYPVTRETNIYSLWHYMGLSSAQQGNNNRMSSTDVEMSRLEHDIQILERDLKDVNCTRDRDDMERELKENKASLRNLKWKKRLRLASN